MPLRCALSTNRRRNHVAMRAMRWINILQEPARKLPVNILRAVYSNDMDSIKRKLKRLVDRTKKWNINSQWLIRIVKGKGKAGRTASSEVEPVMESVMELEVEPEVEAVVEPEVEPEVEPVVEPEVEPVVNREVELEVTPIATRTVPQLPIEVWENVINHLWDDQRALRRCMLVCRAWYSPSLFHLRRSIRIKTVKTVMAYAKKLKRRPELSKRPYDMTIVGKYQETDLSALSTAAIMLARKLPRLERLTIQNSEWKLSTMHGDIFLHLSSFSVTRLHLHIVMFPSITVLARLVCALPGLIELRCDYLRFTHDCFHQDAFGAYHNRNNITSLSLMGGHLRRPQKLIDFLAHPCVSSHLQRLIIDDLVHVTESQHYWECQRLLDVASSSLSELRLHLHYSAPLQAHTEVSAADSVLSFTHNTSLQRLWLNFLIYWGVSDLDALCPVLLSIKPGQLREIVIMFQWSSHSTKINAVEEEMKTFLESDEPTRHEEIDNYLSSASFRTLSKVEFALAHNGDVSEGTFDRGRPVRVAEREWKQQLALLFPRLTKRGIFCATLRKPRYFRNF